MNVTADSASDKKKERSVLKGIGSILLAIVASSHHWVHTLLIALGLTTIGTSLLVLPGPLQALFLIVSLAVSLRFIFVAKRQWQNQRATATVYLISSIISIVLVVAVVPQTVNELFNQSGQRVIQEYEHSETSQPAGGPPANAQDGGESEAIQGAGSGAIDHAAHHRQ
ncbi:MAG TPA: hypothetical protein PKA10_12350 [Selenomonadales bacterium]|nr:hypothetical protein [Selenomonadales bacterium]